MSEEKIYTAAIVGCGRIGYSLGHDEKREQPASHTMAFLENPRISLVAGCDSDEEVIKQWHQENQKALIFTSSEEMYKKVKPEIICIAVNEESHLKEAVAAIKTKPKLVILEKPVAVNMDQAFEIKHAAEENGIPIIVNHERRFSEDYLLAKSYMAHIGTLQCIRATLCSSLAVYASSSEETGAYSLLHDGTHLADAILFFLEDLNNPSSTMEILENPVQNNNAASKNDILLNKPLTVDTTKKITVNTLLKRPVLTGIVRDENGKIRQLCAHYSSHICPDVEFFISGRSKYFGFDIEIFGTEGKICIGNGYCKFYKTGESKLYSNLNSLVSDKNLKAPKKTLYFSNMVKNAVDFLDGRQSLKSTLQTGMNALAILEEIKRKIK